MKKTPLEICALGTAVICSGVTLVLYLYYFRFYAKQDVGLPLFLLFCFLFIIVGVMRDVLTRNPTNGSRPEVLLIGISLVYTSMMVRFLESNIQPAGNLNEYFDSISLVLLLLGGVVLVITLFYSYVDRHKNERISFRVATKPKEYGSELYSTRMYPEIWIPLFVVAVCVLFILVQGITPPVLEIVIIVFLTAGGSLTLFYTLNPQRKTQIILEPDSITQTGKQDKNIPWNCVDRILLLRGVFWTKMCIYYREHDQIKEFHLPYTTLKNKEDFLRSLKRFSRKYGFEFREKVT
jgi:hypothetical protein